MMNNLESIKNIIVGQGELTKPKEIEETCGLHKENLFQFPDGDKICYSCRRDKIEFDCKEIVIKITQKQIYV